MSREERNAAIAAERIKQAQEVQRLIKDESLTVMQACEKAGIGPATYGNWRNRALLAAKPMVRKQRKVTKTNRPTLHTMEVPAPLGRLVAFVGQPAEVLAAVRAM